MPFKMHKIIFREKKMKKKKCVPTLPKFFRPVTRNIIQTHHYHSFYFILQIFTFSNHIMFCLIPSDANDPQRLMRR